MNGLPRILSPITVVVAMLAASLALGQEELRDDREILERKPINQAMNEMVYKRLGAIHRQIADDEYDEALTDLERLTRSPLNNHEKAVLYQTLGFVYVQLDRNQEALASFERSISFNALPAPVTQGLLYSLAGLYAAEGQFERSIETMREWFRYEAEPRADAYIVIASAFAELEQYESALPYVQKAIAVADEPRSNWYMLEVAIHLEAERFREAVGVLLQMLRIWPGESRYWDMLSGLYLELGEDRNALDATMVAYAKGFLTEETELIAAAQLNLLLDTPYTAGEILEKGMNEGLIETNREHLEMLLLAWTNAREYDKAFATIDALAPYAEDGRYFMQKAGIAGEIGDWETTAAAAQQALEAGIDKPYEAHMLAGTAYAELERFDDAIESFRSARASGEAQQRANAASWIAFVEEKVQLQAAAVN